MITNKSQLKNFLQAEAIISGFLRQVASFFFFLLIFPFWVLDPPQNYHYNHNHQADHIRCGTIMDLVVCQLLGLDKPVTSPQVRFCLQCLRRVHWLTKLGRISSLTDYDDKVAASMGYYWEEDGWDEQALTSAGLPVVLLPQVFRSLESNFGFVRVPCCQRIWCGVFCF